MITLFSSPNTRGTRVTWMLEELQAEYEFRLVAFTANGVEPASYLDVNPAGKVPALQDGDLVLTESAAIVTYLGDRFPRQGLVPPAGSALRGKHDQWCCFILSELEQPLWTKAKHRFILPPEKRVPDVVKTAEWEFEKALDIYSKGLAGKEFILGDAFSAADVLAGQTLAWAGAARQSLDAPGVPEYAARILGREALQRARQREAAYR